jgi:light-regulated signal transduction histidine kinase (bacteriophytochrome)
LNIEDLAGSFIVRKILFTKLLHFYTIDFNLFQEINIEFDKIFHEWEKEAFKVLFELQNTHLVKEIEQRTKELSQKNEQLQKIKKDLDNFIYTASHDLKAPGFQY